MTFGSDRCSVRHVNEVEADAPQDEAPPAAEPNQATGTGAGTIAGAAAFVAGAVGTIVAAIGSFGSDDSALAAARRNQVWWLVAAASCAALGLMLGGLYALARNDGDAATAKEDDAPPAGLPPGFTDWRLANAVLAGWARANAARLMLGAGVVAVALGVGLGAYATTNRQPGRPTISLKRIDKQSVRVEITAEGLPSTTWYEAFVRGYGDEPDSPEFFLVSARFSPGQDGKVDWKTRFHMPAKIEDTKLTRILVMVQRDNLVPRKNCVEDEKITCMYVRVPPTVDPKETTA